MTNLSKISVAKQIRGIKTKTILEKKKNKTGVKNYKSKKEKMRQRHGFN